MELKENVARFVPISLPAPNLIFLFLTEAEKKDDETRMEVMFDRLMLMELRENVAKLDARAYAELKAYNNPPEIVLHILRATLAIFYKEEAAKGDFDDWDTVRSVCFYFDVKQRDKNF